MSSHSRPFHTSICASTMKVRSQSALDLTKSPRIVVHVSLIWSALSGNSKSFASWSSRSHSSSDCMHLAGEVAEVAVRLAGAALVLECVGLQHLRVLLGEHLLLVQELRDDAARLLVLQRFDQLARRARRSHCRLKRIVHVVELAFMGVELAHVLRLHVGQRLARAGPASNCRLTPSSLTFFSAVITFFSVGDVARLQLGAEGELVGWPSS